MSQFQKPKILNNLWTLSEITQAAVIVTFWVTLSVFSLSLKVLMHEGYLPIFYFIIWITGLLFSPIKGFTISVIGHFMFDLIYLANPLFLFVWIASGMVTAFIAILRNSKLWRLLFFLPTICYLLAFFIMGYIQFSHPFQYFFVFPGVTLMLLIGNPLFNAFVIWSLRRRPLLIKYLASYCEHHPQNIIVHPVDSFPTQNNACSKTISNASIVSNNQQKFVWCKPKRDLLIYFATFLSVIILWSGVGLLNFFRKPKRSINTFLLLSYPTAYADKSFHQFSPQGTCKYYQIVLQQRNTINRIEEFVQQPPTKTQKMLINPNSRVLNSN